VQVQPDLLHDDFQLSLISFNESPQVDPYRYFVVAISGSYVLWKALQKSSADKEVCVKHAFMPVDADLRAALGGNSLFGIPTRLQLRLLRTMLNNMFFNDPRQT
jgi:hypothetical protein